MKDQRIQYSLEEIISYYRPSDSPQHPESFGPVLSTTIYEPIAITRDKTHFPGRVSSLPPRISSNNSIDDSNKIDHNESENEKCFESVIDNKKSLSIELSNQFSPEPISTTTPQAENGNEQNQYIPSPTYYLTPDGQYYQYYPSYPQFYYPQYYSQDQMMASYMMGYQMMAQMMPQFQSFPPSPNTQFQAFPNQHPESPQPNEHMEPPKTTEINNAPVRSASETIQQHPPTSERVPRRTQSSFKPEPL